VGKGMTEDNIGKACAFLVGPCSCTIKRLNPGTDMLMTADWIIGVKEPLVKDVQIPSLPGLSEKVSPENVVPAPAPGGATKPAPKTDKPSTDKPKKKDGAAKPAVVPDAATEPAPKKDEPQKDGAAAPVSSSAAAAV
jgi:hypothetical protein